MSDFWETDFAPFGVDLPTDTFMDLVELDESELAPEQLIGRMVDWHGQPGTIVEHPHGGGIAVEIELTCATCRKNSERVLVQSGLHTGAFCYVIDAKGKFLADLRNQEYVCDECMEQRRNR